MFVYADNAATTSVSKTALDAMMPYLTTLYGNPSSLYSFAQKAKEALEDARKTVAPISSMGVSTFKIALSMMQPTQMASIV